MVDEQSLVLSLFVLLIGESLFVGAAMFNDFEYASQEWVFEMINVEPVWKQGIFGKGVRVRVNDNGVDSDHDEFGDRFDVDASCTNYDALFYDEDRGFYNYTQHGTTVASIIGASGDNRQCAVGVAPEVTISSCKLFDGSLTFSDLDDFLDSNWLIEKLDKFDISQNSIGWGGCRNADSSDTVPGGFPDTYVCPFKYKSDDIIYDGQLYDKDDIGMDHPCDVCSFPSRETNIECLFAVRNHCRFHFEEDMEACSDSVDMLVSNGECDILSSSDILRRNLEIGANEGRDGKGIIFVFAAGNDFTAGDDVNYKYILKERYIIAVGALGKDALRATYSTGGAALFVSAPGGDYEYMTNHMVAVAGGGCSSSGVGTSFACPVVSAVIALMLDANPSLTWRDVQGIIAMTSRPVNNAVSEDKTIVVNGAGLWHSNLYGFGIIDAGSAVERAKKWISYGEEELLTAQANDLNLVINDDEDLPTVSDLTIESPGRKIIVENIEVEVYLDHFTRGHLKISLTSPDGTVSELTPGSRPENSQLDENTPWRLRTVRSWGEAAEGTWSLSIADMKPGDAFNCADTASWLIEWNGYDLWNCDKIDSIYYRYLAPFEPYFNKLYDGGLKDACCACGGGNGPSNFCRDFDGFENACQNLPREICSNGQVSDFFQLYAIKDTQGRTVRDACCFFGGGNYFSDPSKFEDKLKGWKLNIYGHEEIVTTSPTQEPSLPPTMGSSSDSKAGLYFMVTSMLASTFIFLFQ